MSQLPFPVLSPEEAAALIEDTNTHRLWRLHASRVCQGDPSRFGAPRRGGARGWPAVQGAGTDRSVDRRLGRRRAGQGRCDQLSRAVPRQSDIAQEDQLRRRALRRHAFVHTAAAGALRLLRQGRLRHRRGGGCDAGRSGRVVVLGRCGEHLYADGGQDPDRDQLAPSAGPARDARHLRAAGSPGARRIPCLSSERPHRFAGLPGRPSEDRRHRDDQPAG